MTPAVFEIVSADANCIALLGEAPRMRFWEDELPQGTSATLYAVWQMPTGTPENYLNQLPDIDGSRVQVDVYGIDKMATRVAATAIRDAIEPHAQMLQFSSAGRDATTRKFRYLLEFSFFTSR